MFNSCMHPPKVKQLIKKNMGITYIRQRLNKINGLILFQSSLQEKRNIPIERWCDGLYISVPLKNITSFVEIIRLN